MKKLAILGSTGSIGTSTLKVIENFKDRYRVAALTAGNNIGLIQKQIEQKRTAHKAFVSQLKAIKNQAEKEGAKKTTAMLDNLIKMEEKKTAESVNKLEKDREKLAEQIERYKRPDRTRPAEEKKVEVKKTEVPKPAEPEKKKKKWWKFGRD